ncbi:MAG: hypothetical protein RRC34_13875 [Lentisphaeria bacterium]|nr:hypothetical protein [Lentisphaeria bacterium]
MLTEKWGREKKGRGKQCEEPLIHTDSTLIFENWEEGSHKKAQKATKKNQRLPAPLNFRAFSWHLLLCENQRLGHLEDAVFVEAVGEDPRQRSAERLDDVADLAGG